MVTKIVADSSSKWRPGLGLAGARSVLRGNRGSDRHRDLPKANHCRGRWPKVFISFPTLRVPLTAPRTQRKTLPKRSAPSAPAASPGRGTWRRGLRPGLSSPGGRPGDRAFLPPPLVNTGLGPSVTGHLAGCWGQGASLAGDGQRRRVGTSSPNSPPRTRTRSPQGGLHRPGEHLPPPRRRSAARPLPRTARRPEHTCLGRPSSGSLPTPYAGLSGLWPCPGGVFFQRSQNGSPAAS